jgi:hypothetical protein
MNGFVDHTRLQSLARRWYRVRIGGFLPLARGGDVEFVRLRLAHGGDVDFAKGNNDPHVFANQTLNLSLF